jgi:2-hydroxychromene-2-carboxylate isomerase
MSMADPIDFYFDFSSPYGYLAAVQIEAIAAKHRRAVAWRPHLLGVAFKLTNARPLVDMPIKSDYFKHDWDRFARMLGVPLKLPSPFPFLAVNPSRAFFWLQARDPALAVRFAKAAYHASFGEARDISGADACADIAATLGVDKAEVKAGIGAPGTKEKLRVEVDAALARNVFGSPFVIVDGEAFWGADRLNQVDRWLEKRW